MADAAATSPLGMLSGLPSFTGGTAGPSRADGSLSNSVSFGNSFAVGEGASATAENSGQGGGASSAAGDLIPWVVIALGVIGLVAVLKGLVKK